MPKNRTKNKFKKNKAILPKSDSQQHETQPKLVSKTVGGVTVEVPDNPRYIVRTIKNFEDLLDEAKKKGKIGIIYIHDISIFSSICFRGITSIYMMYIDITDGIMLEKDA